MRGVILLCLDLRVYLKFSAEGMNKFQSAHLMRGVILRRAIGRQVHRTVSIRTPHARCDLNQDWLI